MPRQMVASSGHGVSMVPQPTPGPVPLGSSHTAPKPLPRKKAVVLGLLNAVDKGDEKYEEVHHSDGKVSIRVVIKLIKLPISSYHIRSNLNQFDIFVLD